MPGDDFRFVKTKKRSKRKTDTNQKVLITAATEGHECSINKEIGIR
jgi:hypothetical protein